MKSRPKTKIDITNRDDVVMLEGLAEFITQLINRESVLDARVEITEFIDGNFCLHCYQDHDNCECGERHEKWRDYDYDYDNWVDRQMEEQGND